MANCLAPGYAKLAYHANGHDHVLTLPINPSGSGTGLSLIKKGGGTISRTDALTALLAVVVPLFHTTDSFSNVDWFLQADCDSAPVFQTSSTLVGIVGTSSAADQAWVQALITFRTQGGGRGKFQLMEGIMPADRRGASPTFDGYTQIQDLAEYLVSADSWIYARDNTYLAAALNLTTKINDELRKKYLLG